MDTSLRCLLISDFNLSNFAGLLENDSGIPALEPQEAPFGQVIPILADPAHSCWSDKPDLAVVWTLPEKVVPQFQSLLENLPADAAGLREQVDAYAALLVKAAERVKWLIVPTWAFNGAWHGAGVGDWQAEGGVARALAEMNLRLAKRLGGAANICLLDSQRWLAFGGSNAFSEKLWYQGKIAFSHEVFREAARDLKATLLGLMGQSRKLIVLDLDDTLWGGIVGDVGWEGVKLGGHDPLGEAYVDFQRALKALTRRGIVLGMVSKNDEEIALGVLRQHPEMQLREGDFAGWRINWEDKAANLAELAAELNLGLQSVVFIDDNPAERARIRDALPEVLVPEWPDNPMLYKRALASLRCFSSPQVSAEDRARAEAYAVERRRTELKRAIGSVEDWLRGLQIRVTVERLTPANLGRAAQLLNKTNQMNLATRRMSDRELRDWAQDASHRLWTFRVSDKLGDSGLTGLGSLRMEGGKAHIVDFILSCRVMGRKVEETMAHWLVEQARQAGAAEVRAEYRPTAKNKPCLEFWQRSGFTMAEANCFCWSTDRDYPRPDYIDLKNEEPANPAVTKGSSLSAGMSFQVKCVASAREVEQFIALTGDDSPLHADEEYARRSVYQGILVHGLHSVLFLAALPVFHRPGLRAEVKSISANFNQPIYRDDPLLLTGTVADWREEERELELEFQVSNERSGVWATTGRADLAYAPLAAVPSFSATPGGDKPLLVHDPLKGEPVRFEQIERGREEAFQFGISLESLRHYHGMLRDSVAGFDLEFADWLAHCDPPALAASALVSPFVGQCIPGSYGTCLNFDLAFKQPLEIGRRYRFVGKVSFKSASSNSILTTIAIDDPARPGGRPLASGKIHAGVQAPKE